MDKTNTQQETFSKSEVLDAAEECMKKGLITMEHVIELENNGMIFDRSARTQVEKFLAGKK